MKKAKKRGLPTSLSTSVLLLHDLWPKNSFVKLNL